MFSNIPSPPDLSPDDVPNYYQEFRIPSISNNLPLIVNEITKNMSDKVEPYAGPSLSSSNFKDVKLGNSINRFSRIANEIAHDKGFYDEGKSLETAIALQHSELSEVLEALRDGNPESEKLQGFSQLEEEYADLIIRILDTCGEHELNVGDAIIAKMKYNSDREYKHGKEF